MIGCQCEVCRSSDPRDKRTRPSVIISYDDQQVLVDTTPELRIQCLANQVQRITAIVVTHGHADHIMGLDDVRRFNAIMNTSLDVWANEPTHAALKRCFGYAFKEPDPAELLFRPRLVPRLIEGPFTIGSQQWTPIPLLHGSMPVLGFRVGSIAYCTDVSSIPESSYELLQGLDVLVLDALQHRRHTTHFSIEEATEASRRIGAKQTYFTHIAHALGHEQTNAMLPPNMQLAYDGLVVRGRAS